jgi:hypothetical protein
VKSAFNGSPAYAATSFETHLLGTLTEWLMATLLALATAAVVIWQNLHLAVLWDLSYTLNNAYRIALGDVPYRDFPFAHPPLTFLIQAAIIKLTGAVYWHAIAYCAVTGAIATVLAWRIMRRILDGLPHAQIIALLLTLPLVPLGIYCVFPHPFYDPDCTLAILIAILLLLRMDQKQNAIGLPAVAGLALVVPLFVKQNTGLAFLLSSVALLIVLVIWQRIRLEPVRNYAVALAAVVLALGVAVLLIHRSAGLGNYWHWTIQFAAARRTPARREMLEIYTGKMNLLWIGSIVAGVLVVRFTRAGKWLWLTVAAILLAAPFLWPTIYLLRDSDASERADRLINIWPVLLIVAFVSGLATINRRHGIRKILPFVIIAAIQGCFMSQQLWGSTYGIWPLFAILLAMTLVDLSAVFRLAATPSSGATYWPNRLALTVSSLITLSLFIAGTFYVRSHERLSYANLDDGELHRTTLARLKGLSTRGDWIPGFEELVHYANSTIPPDAGILLLPGEDPFYYATGRRPQFPVLLFDHTVNPYSPEEIRTLCRERNIQWLIVKQEQQDEEDAIDTEKDQITAALDEDFEQVESLGNYDIYRRVDPSAKKDSDADDDSDDDDDKP